MQHFRTIRMKCSTGLWVNRAYSRNSSCWALQLSCWQSWCDWRFKTARCCYSDKYFKLHKESSDDETPQNVKACSAGLIDIIGTDAHSFDHNTPELYSDAIECIAKKCGQQAVDRLMKNSEKIFNAAISWYIAKIIIIQIKNDWFPFEFQSFFLCSVQ